MDPLAQANALFVQLVGTSAENLILFVVGNENITAVRRITNDYLAAVAHQIGVTPPPL